ncbi:bifunctional DNA-formamidopyrimidine glycosylase/DNA-(apurinic or apyrimidinic site) lyase [Cellvibrio japonicus]|uniref:Formamidopyrimidine-DNA glycosylase n=1 Tax=Cellvibrio japonicus (strain Ueda107) TaxID=498211 RepID=FPG_CELJU|nr:bifunctional DNA-formamidopyrimidine glycosylase/DNA-(apurinic or apyrimidinic site) lyase [Cellvibrio japonicus]B3PG51.1 RecName: Full=Formamidopyrimidine-DNA glycosylase; Short=Fapy-DNA glycosylase; AltName: Full=DNA-(apurinic or apyrimidinic site) lyase MutM; Short=AP lyase MutM [Cellvibrio japonicus Ueda107]ACE84778.1 formamidopyrimidine-DNA glycosylase [Cellvibrio japonicus Ueda107]QEI13728.1 bifunctional DNA-formamidopyrimidine glycosylase/DNA-(apurinic or apyrimidinic site) lyase [Cell
MPELPEVETTLRGVSPHILGRKVTDLVIRQPRLRWPIPLELSEQLPGQQLKAASRRGKYLLLSFNTGTALIHLGMSGSLRIVKPEEPPLFHDHFDMHFGNRILRYCDPRRFGCLLWEAGDIHQHALLRDLGPEPLGDDFTPAYLYERSRKRTQAIKQFIMDSKIVVGVGNIYANESLFMAGIKPIRKAGALSRHMCEDLVRDIRFVLQRSITQGGTTLRDFVGGDGKPGYFQQQLLVYGRGGEACKTCQKPLKEIRMNDRTTVYCVTCQQ